MSRPRDDGFVTVFVVCFTAALLLVIGLVLDGGYVLAARRQAMDEAEGAARAGAQSVALSTRSGPVALDPRGARAAAEAYMAPTGHLAVVDTAGDEVTVTVTFSRHLLILGAAGLADVRVSARARARAVPGIEQAGG